MRISAVALVFALACSSNPKPEPTTPNEAAGGQASGEQESSEPAEGEPAGAEAGGETAEGGSEQGAEKPEGPAEGDSRTTQTIAKTIQANRKPIRACYDKVKKSMPDLKGTMTIHFVLDPEGKVKKAELNVERSDIKAPDVVDCAIAEIKKLKFPPSSKGMDTTVNYPFDFKPDGGG